MFCGALHRQGERHIHKATINAGPILLIPFSEAREVPDCDVCVVGAGPVGIALALACERQGLSVLLLESGQERPDRFAAALTAGHHVDTRSHATTDMAMCRALGGTSRWW